MSVMVITGEPREAGKATALRFAALDITWR
ncbi:Uncharacterised protein [Klebsiella pneumoniae]|uniref:Uncharacterized protein n=1 Tax=Klebsiella pneumoniae TaxID=573 RepID=A0A377TVI5_KLEPN|nr:Uncharacterised protein [Klebsiella pneumoniae]